MSHALMENRNGLAVDSRLTLTSGTAEWEAALEMFENLPWVGRITVGGDKNFDVPVFVNGLRSLQATPHVAQKAKSSAIYKRATRHEGDPVRRFASASKKSSAGSRPPGP